MLRGVARAGGGLNPLENIVESFCLLPPNTTLRCCFDGRMPSGGGNEKQKFQERFWHEMHEFQAPRRRLLGPRPRLLAGRVDMRNSRLSRVTMKKGLRPGFGFHSESRAEAGDAGDAGKTEDSERANRL